MPFKAKKNIVLREEDGEAILFDPESLLTVILNETSIFIWHEIEKGLSENEILVNMKNSYDNISEAGLKQDIKTCLEQFKSLGFIKE